MFRDLTGRKHSVALEGFRADEKGFQKQLGGPIGADGGHRYQFLIDGSLRVQDPYAEKILDPLNDTDPELQKVYPNLKPYPSLLTGGIVSVLQTNQPGYKWAIENFTKPAKEKLVIYELLIRDFVSTHSYTTLMDTLSYFKKLGVNAIELMPINEFEGNNSSMVFRIKPTGMAKP